MMSGFWRPNSRNFSAKKFRADVARDSPATLGPLPRGWCTPYPKKMDRYAGEAWPFAAGYLVDLYTTQLVMAERLGTGRSSTDRAIVRAALNRAPCLLCAC